MDAGSSFSSPVRPAWIGCLPPSPAPPPKSCSKAMPQRSASVPIPSAASFSATNPAPASVGGAQWLFAAIATRSPASPAAAFLLPRWQPGLDRRARPSAYANHFGGGGSDFTYFGGSPFDHGSY